MNKSKKFGFTLAEVGISLLIVGILAGATGLVIKRQLAKSNEYSYYMAYRTVEKLAGQIVAASTETNNPQDNTEETTYNSNNTKLATAKEPSFVLKLVSKLGLTENKVFKTLFPKAYAEIVTVARTYEEPIFGQQEVNTISVWFTSCNNSVEPALDYQTSAMYGEFVTEENFDLYNKAGEYCAAFDQAGGTVGSDPNKILTNEKDGSQVGTRMYEPLQVKVKKSSIGDFYNRPSGRSFDSSGFATLNTKDFNLSNCFSTSTTPVINKESESDIEQVNMVGACTKKFGYDQLFDHKTCDGTNPYVNNIYNVVGTYKSYYNNYDFSRCAEGDEGRCLNVMNTLCERIDDYRFDSSQGTCAASTNTSGTEYDATYLKKDDFRGSGRSYCVYQYKTDRALKSLDSYPYSYSAEPNSINCTTNHSNMKADGNICVCQSGFVKSSNAPSLACCSASDVQEGKNLYYTGGSTCVACAPETYSPTAGACCPANSRYYANDSQGGPFNNGCKCNSGYGDKDGQCVRTKCNGKGLYFDEEKGICIPKTGVIKASRFCELIADNFNIDSDSKSCDTFKESDGNEYYEAVYNAVTKNSTLSSISADTSLKYVTPNIIFANGLKLWILGDKQASIPGFTSNPSNITPTKNMCQDITFPSGSTTSITQGDCNETDNAYYCGAEKRCMKVPAGSSVLNASNCCSSATSLDNEKDERSYAMSGFTVYVDINGDKGNSKLWEDIYPFYIATDGMVYPGYPLDAMKQIPGKDDSYNSNSVYMGGNSSAYLPVNLYYIEPGPVAKKHFVKTGVSFAYAACMSRRISPYAPYCSNLGKNSSINDFLDELRESPCATKKCFINVQRKYFLF